MRQKDHDTEYWMHAEILMVFHVVDVVAVVAVVVAVVAMVIFCCDYWQQMMMCQCSSYVYFFLSLVDCIARQCTMQQLY